MTQEWQRKDLSNLVQNRDIKKVTTILAFTIDIDTFILKVNIFKTVSETITKFRLNFSESQMLFASEMI